MTTFYSSIRKAVVKTVMNLRVARKEANCLTVRTADYSLQFAQLAHSRCGLHGNRPVVRLAVYTTAPTAHVVCDANPTGAEFINRELRTVLHENVTANTQTQAFPCVCMSLLFCRRHRCFGGASCLLLQGQNCVGRYGAGKFMTLRTCF